MTGSAPQSDTGRARAFLDANVQPGFSLIEMMIALAIAGILFFVALPGYQYAVLKSTRASARAALLDVMSRQEQYVVNNKRYGTALAEIGLPEPYYIDNKGEAVGAALSSYRVSLDVLDGAYLGVTARPMNRQASDSGCLAFSLSVIGARAVTGTLSASPGDCW